MGEKGYSAAMFSRLALRAPPLRRPHPVPERARVERETEKLSSLFAQLSVAPLVSSEHLYHEYARYWSHRLDLVAYDARVPSRLEFYGTSALARQKSSGRERLAYLFKMLDVVLATRSEWQISLHLQMIRATLFQILGKDYETTVDAVCESMGWQGAHQELMCIASRRSGKTFGTACYAAVMMICCPNIEIVIFSLSKRQSQKMLALIAQMVMRCEAGKKMINSISAERLTLKGDDNAADVRQCLSFPGRSDVRTRRALAPPKGRAGPKVRRRARNYKHVRFGIHRLSTVINGVNVQVQVWLSLVAGRRRSLQLTAH